MRLLSFEHFFEQKRCILWSTEKSKKFLTKHIFVLHRHVDICHFVPPNYEKNKYELEIWSVFKFNEVHVWLLTVEEGDGKYDESSQGIPMEVHVVDPVDARNPGELVIFRHSYQKLKKNVSYISALVARHHS